MTLQGVGRPVESNYKKEFFMEMIGMIAEFLVLGVGLLAAYLVSVVCN